jgi:hypothetical protein
VTPRAAHHCARKCPAPPLDASQLSTMLSPRETDQRMVEALKTGGYRQLARALVENHTDA